jgi:hypothetical protein
MTPKQLGTKTASLFGVVNALRSPSGHRAEGFGRGVGYETGGTVGGTAGAGLGLMGGLAAGYPEAKYIGKQLEHWDAQDLRSIRHSGAARAMGPGFLRRSGAGMAAAALRGGRSPLKIPGSLIAKLLGGVAIGGIGGQVAGINTAGHLMGKPSWQRPQAPLK